MKIAIPACLLVIGVIGGYFLGVNKSNSHTEPGVNELNSIVENVIYDTIYKTKYIEINNVDVNHIVIDSNLINSRDSIEPYINRLDTLKEKLLSKPKDSLIQDSFLINRDELIDVKILSIIYLDEKGVDSDSLIKNALNITSIEKEKMSIEFWKSPIDYHGYKLSLSKLIIYGLSPQLDYSLYKKDGYYYLTNQNICFELKENSEFSSYTQVDSQIIFND